VIDTSLLYFSNSFGSCIIISHNSKNVCVHSSESCYLQPLARICRSIFPGVSLDPDPASPFREVSAALLCFNDLHRVSCNVRYIVSCILNVDGPFVFPRYLIELLNRLIALSRYITFKSFVCRYFLFLHSENATLLDTLRYDCKLYQLTMLTLCLPQENLRDFCYLVFTCIVHSITFIHNFLRFVSSFLFICIDLLPPSLQQSISNGDSQSNHGPDMRTFPQGGGFRYELQFDAIEPYLLTGCDGMSEENVFVFVDHVDSIGQLSYPADKCFVHVSIPLESMVPFLPVKMVLKIAKLHHMSLGSHVPKSEIIRSFDGHSCASCNLYHSVFAVVASKSKTKSLKGKNRVQAFRSHLNYDKPSLDSSDAAEVLFPLDPMLEPVNYPPPPFNDAHSRKIISNFCAKSDKTLIEEAGCSVCGQLVPTAQLTRLKAVKNLLNVLEVPDVTRIQRKKDSDPIRGYKGPVLDYSCDRICDGCRHHVRNGKVPRNALANGLWLGPIPEELACLGFIEKLLVARVHINSCFIRVASSGLRKMTSHVIAFESPVPKVYHRLPPPMEDLDDVLAVLFTGPCKPTDKEFQRTPLLVRRKQVARALEWLKLNHADYADLEIAYDELNRYPEDSLPVTIEYQHSETTKIEEGSSTFDNDDGHGVHEGECPFIVHGLTGTEYDTKSLNTLKGIALRHWNNRGAALAVSHGSSPLSIYNNPNLYPQIFPWLFPYGLGGIGFTPLSDKTHKRHLLMYHDKRFQKDICFPFVAFSHQQVKASTTGGLLLAETRNFENIANRLLSVNQDVLNDLAKRMSIGEVIKPSTDDERSCFQLIRDLDHIDGKVDGSITSKKHMRSEIWSMMTYMGAPSWYITLSPADNKHPICLYFADNKERLDVELIRSEDERYRLIANNPVAGARFFHFMVQMFIEHVLGVSTETTADHLGVYGKTAGYYGTVEQQGRLTLHLHMLLWICGTCSPEEARLQILDPDSKFRSKLIEYLESCHAGDFISGPMENVASAVKTASEKADYKNPTETLPEPPPPSCHNPPHNGCHSCDKLSAWSSRYQFTVDDLLLKSNVHKCSTNRNKDGSQNKARPYKGCLDNIWGRCKARFPRLTYAKTEIDTETGSISLKKSESWLNTFTYVVTYLFRCNTDITSLRSGTAIKGVFLYVTNYVTKPVLKTHVIFDTVRSMFQKNAELIAGDETRKEKARKLMTKIVNSLAGKMEWGSPIGCMYLLGNPDHYTNYMFTPFYWKSFVQEARKAWEPQNIPTEKIPQCNLSPAGPDPLTKPINAVDDQHREKVTIFKRNGRVIGLSPVHDYICRPLEFETTCLYDWISRYRREKRRVNKKKKSSKPKCVDSEAEVESDCETDGGYDLQAPVRKSKSKLYFFTRNHPLVDTHGVHWLSSDSRARIPNFIGESLPRCDQGDREFYCSTMLALFRPWRSGLDLKNEGNTWDEAFTLYQFSTRHLVIIKNMNLRYECLDARDDFHAQMRNGGVNMPAWAEQGAGMLQDLDQMAIEDAINGSIGRTEPDDFLLSTHVGRRNKARIELMTDIRRTLTTMGWTNHQSKLLPETLNITPDPIQIEQTPGQWKAAVAAARAEILEERARHMPPTVDSTSSRTFIPDDVRVVDKSYMSRSFVSKVWQKTIDSVSAEYSLNTEQDRAFRLIANHACSHDSDQLKMYIAGMAGTGKSQVLKSLVEFFRQKNESHRLIMVAPTGSAAALLKGSTYHSAFGINSDGGLSSNIQLAQVKSRLEGVDYIFLDEVSMLSCRDLYLISARLARVMNNLDTSFGGLNMIFAGDFAQLPPVIGQEHSSLYSRTVGKNTTSLHDQEAAIGKALWHQVTTVVILRQNMRQRSQSEDDAKFREALSNMRYKACTPADIMFLKSRVSSELLGRSNVNERQFRNVSIITTLNSQKDEINDLGSQRFASETKQTLTDFYSIDTVPTKDSDNTREKRNRPTGKKHLINHGIIPEDIQRALWDQPACANTKLIPGKLSLCIGMPIMIRNNAATELCITKGQEAFVYAWQSHKLSDGKDILDTLFVELANPPSPVKIEGLPLNVVPLMRTSVVTNCKLPDDTSLTISRSQVEALPNFAMTDYASQGKTRSPSNVVELSHCRTHQGYYTALSRGATAAGTLILTSFHPSKVTGGASGALRQEFRELELLDDITRLRFEDRIPRSITMADRRNTLIDSFRAHRGKNYMPSTLHKAIRWSATDPFLEWKEYGDWRILGSKTDCTKADHSTHTTSKPPPPPPSTPVQNYNASALALKRKSSQVIRENKQPFLKRIKYEHQINTSASGSTDMSDPVLRLDLPLGTSWSSNSCAYDAVFVILFNIWREDPIPTSTLWHTLQSEFLDLLITSFETHESFPHARTSQRFSLEEIRDFMRRRLARISTEFVFGRYTSVHSIIERFFTTSDPVTISDLMCPNGHVVDRQGRSPTSSCEIIVFSQPGTSLQHCMDNFSHSTASKCLTCDTCLLRATSFVQSPPVIIFDLGTCASVPSLSSVLWITCGETGRVCYNLRGIVYYNNQHFTSRFVTGTGMIWFHDGLLTGTSLIYEGQDVDSITTETAIMAFYTRV
jgi:Helitron helicase-like domain at N-terminus/PIF1-like helicase